MSYLLGGVVETAPVSEYGKTEVDVDTNSVIFEGVSSKTICWMSHTDYIAKAPEGFKITATTPVCPVAAMEPVSYTHLDVYKRQVQIRQWKLALSQGTRAAVARVGGAGKQLWRWRKKKWVRLTGIGLVILIVLFSVTQAVKYWSYDNYTVQTDFTGEDTTAASYRKVEDKVLKYSLDGAALSDSSGTAIWTNAYNMNCLLYTSRCV